MNHPHRILAVFSILVLSVLCVQSRAEAKRGFFLGANGAAHFLSNDGKSAGSPGLDLDPGPGFDLRLGYDWGVLALRGSIYYWRMGYSGTQVLSTQFFPPNFFSSSFSSGREEAQSIGGLIDVLVYPLGSKNSSIQPYVAAGFGGSYIDAFVDSADFGIEDIKAFVPHAALGIDFLFGEHFALVVEGDWKPHLYDRDIGFQDSENNNHTLHFFSLGAGLKVVF